MIRDLDTAALLMAYTVWFELNQLDRESLGDDEFIYPTTENRKLTYNSLSLDDIKFFLHEFRSEGAIKKIKTINRDRKNKSIQWSIQIDSHYFKELGKKIDRLVQSKSADINFDDTASRKGLEKKWDVLQSIWDLYESHSRPESVFVPVARLTIKGRDTKLIDGIIEGFKKEDLFQKWDRKDRWYNLEFINHEKLPKVYEVVRGTYKKFASAYQQKEKNNLKQNNGKVPLDHSSEFLITVRDREIRINNYLIAKPHAVGSNYDFFEYIRSQPANEQIKREDLDTYLQQQLKNKRFFKTLNALGFKGEIKRAFFHKVDANTLCYRGDKLTLQQLKKHGVNIKLFIKELEVADAKYNPN